MQFTLSQKIWLPTVALAVLVVAMSTSSVLRTRSLLAVAAERVARRIIISVARSHVGLERDRAFCLDLLPKRPLQRSQATLSVPAIGSARSRRPFAVNIR